MPPNPSSHNVMRSPDPPLPEPVFGGLTATPSLAAFGVFVGAGWVFVGTGVAVFGDSVGVAVGVCVFSFRGVVGVAVHSGAAWNACIWPIPWVGVAVASHGTWPFTAWTTPDVPYAVPSMSAPAAIANAPIIIHLFNLTVSPPERVLVSNSSQAREYATSITRINK
jgi:hypothetical protein